MRFLRILTCLVFLLVGFTAAFSPGLALAQEEEGTPAPEITLQTTYPKIEAIAGQDFQFSVQLSYLHGDKSRDFDLKTTIPQGWTAYMTPQYETSTRISAIHMDVFSSSYTLQVTAHAPVWPLPDPGDYPVTLEVSSGDLKASLTMTAVITASYSLTVKSPTDLYNTKAKPGQDNHFSIELDNFSTAPVENIKFSTTQPGGWTIDFNPEKIDKLDAFDSQTMDVNIKPPTNTIAGDYIITLRGSGTQATADAISIRVTVETPSVWGWVGVGIIVLVAAGLVVIFMRFSRR